MKFHYAGTLVSALAAVTALSCNSGQNNNEGQETTGDETPVETVYEADLSPLNSDIVGGETTGKATFTVADGQMKVVIDVEGAPAGIQHWQHFHGFPDNKDADIATMDQDENGDGIVDVVETGAVSGTTMVPFNKIPTAMDLGEDTYPEADENGAYHYEVTIPMDELNKTFGDAFDGADVDLDKRVLYIHGIPDDVDLPASVETVHDIPAQITIPIANGKINRVN